MALAYYRDLWDVQRLAIGRSYDPTARAAGWFREQLLAGAGELDHLAGAEHAHLERGARRDSGQPIADLLDVVLGHHGDALHRENDVAPHGHLFPTDGDGPVPALQAHVPRRRALGHRLDQEAGGRGDVEDGGEVPAEQEALERAPEYFPRDQEVLRALDRHDEAEALAATGLRDVLADDADDLAGHVEDGAPGVALVDRRRGLQELREGHVGEDGAGRPACADPADAHRIGQPVGGADHHDLLADLHRVGITQPRHPHRLGHAL